jgi:XTP/dITP diphosphohydrolase
VHSARFAGDGCTYADNRVKLLSELDGVTDRRAAFRTCVLVRRPDGSEIVVDGTCAGVITEHPRGAGGFGYDAIFEPADGDGRTFAEMTDAEKHAISHRGRAFRNLLAALAG